MRPGPLFRFFLLLLLPLLGAAADRVPLAEAPGKERAMLDRYLGAPDWPIRVFGLLRLERYSGGELEAILRRAAGDDAWQVRCFALRQAARLGVSLSAADLPAGDDDPRVIRSALRHGVALDPELVETTGLRLLRTKTLDALLLGFEIAAASDSARLRAQAARHADTLVRNMDETVRAVAGARLAALFRIDPVPPDVRHWQAWLTAQGGEVRELPAPDPPRSPGAAAGAAPIVADMDLETFTRLLDYLDVLRQRDLDMVLVMDATASMVPMIDEARAGVDSLILFFDDVSRRMRLAFIAYRDHDNRPVWDGEVFTTDVERIRRFLFGIRITGGADLPEAVYDGLAACRRLDFDSDAQKQIILVGDARPHETDTARTLELAGRFAADGVVVHAVHVKMEIDPQRQAFISEQQRLEVERHNQLTEVAFSEIAEAGGGRLVRLEGASDLVPAILHVTIEEGWWSVFDEFYALYKQLCR